ncbi:MAG: carboxypeptidase-like regulatory domain-containing protein [Myxococcota bacterium]|nr:carboxypeptidase-like regulatory domain-containing protein [Myxococcota bacterium]
MRRQQFIYKTGQLMALLGLIAACSSDSLEYIERGGAPIDAAPAPPSLPGHLEGQLCNHASGQWLPGVQVTLDLPEETLTRQTDMQGFFRFSPVPAGAYRLGLQGHPVLHYLEATVQPEETTRLGGSECDVPRGDLEGRICGPSGRWLVNATVSISTPDFTLAAQTNASGEFALRDVPMGNYEVKVSRGSFSTSFTATIEPEVITRLPEPVCIPPTTRMAVVTGIYDEVQLVLQGLGFELREYYTDRTMGITYPLSPEGSVDLINGSNSSFWIEEFLSDPMWMGEYDILLFNCGLSDSLLNTANEHANEALQNLRAWVRAGGSLYASDWASEVVRMAFPERVNFVGDDLKFGHSRVGVENERLSAQIMDPGLQLALGTSSIRINLNLPLWSVLEETQHQPPDLRVLVQGDVSHFEPGNYTINADSEDLPHSPLIVHFDEGAGRVLLTAGHTERQTTEDLRNVLRYIIFEL